MDESKADESDTNLNKVVFETIYANESAEREVDEPDEKESVEVDEPGINAKDMKVDNVSFEIIHAESMKIKKNRWMNQMKQNQLKFMDQMKQKSICNLMIVMFRTWQHIVAGLEVGLCGLDRGDVYEKVMMELYLWRKQKRLVDTSISLVYISPSETKSILEIIMEMLIYTTIVIMFPYSIISLRS